MTLMTSHPPNLPLTPGRDPLFGCASAVHRLYIEHFVGSAKPIAFIERLSGIGRMQCDHLDFLLTGFSQCLIDQKAGQFFPSMFGFHVHIQQVTALVLAWIQGVRRPVENDQAGACNDLAACNRKPAQVSSIRQPGFHPRLEVLCHHIQNPVVLAAGVDKHPAPVMGDDGRICRRRCPYLIHARSIASGQTAHHLGRRVIALI